MQIVPAEHLGASETRLPTYKENNKIFMAKHSRQKDDAGGHKKQIFAVYVDRTHDLQMI